MINDKAVTEHLGHLPASDGHTRGKKKWFTLQDARGKKMLTMSVSSLEHGKAVFSTHPGT